MGNENKLSLARKEIDCIDAEMSRLFSKRMKAVALIAEEKMKDNRNITDKDREEAVIRHGIEYIEDEDLKPLYICFISEIIDISKRYQAAIMEEKNMKECQNEN